VKPDLENAELAIARTDPPYDGRTAVREVLHAWLDLIGTAKRSVYIENQYLTSAAVGDALAERLGSSDCPEVVIVITHGCSGWLEEATMGVLRARLLERLKAADRCNRLRIYYVCAGAGVDVKIHSKVMIIDDQIARIGSANLNNRSMGLDTECDVFIEARGRPDVQDAILALRDRLLGEHLGVAPIEVRDAVARHGSLGAAIEALRGGAHTLVPLEVDRDSWIDLVIPDGTLTDPEQPVSMTDLVGQLAPDDLTPLRGPLEWAAIVAVATAIAAGICYATPLSAQVAAFGVDAGLAPWRDGPLAPVVASGAVAIGALSLAPVTLLIALCGFVLGPWMGFVTALCGAALAAFAGYAIGARLPRDAAERLVGQRIAELSRRVRSGGARAVFVVRLFPSASFGAVNLFAGAARYSLRDFWFGTLCAIAPAALALAMLGHAAALAVARHGSAALAGATALALAAMAALLAILSQIRARAVGRGSMA
jgi:uncharacterized membrane protein YdjX (TVP38/TMEM64 family)